MATTQSLVAKYPDNKDYAQDLIEIYRFTGDCLRNQANIDQAQVQYQNWLDLANRLADKQPVEIAWLRDQMFAHQRMGDILREMGDFDRAFEQFHAYHEAAATLIKMEAPNAPNLTWRLDLAISNQRIGDMLLERKEHTRARA